MRLRDLLVRGVIVGGMALGTVVHAQPPAQIDRLAWLAGCWEQRGPGRLTTETWMPPFGGAMIGASRTVIGGALREFEHIRITTDSARLVYTALPSGQREAKFPAITASDTSIVFENLQHDFPQRIIYRKRGADSVIARIEGPGPNNSTRGTNFPFRRVSCTDRTVPPPPPDTTIVNAALAPNGQQLLVVKGVAQNMDIHSVNIEGGALKQLTDHPNVDYQPAWAPDGKRFAFVGVHDGHQEIYTMLADGTGVAQLTRGAFHNSEPAWSPDGKQIVFRSERDGRPHIYVMNADGSAQRAITRDSSVGASPAFSRDGKRIIFSSTRTTHNEVWTMNLDGTNQVQLTTTPVMHSGGPSYSPNGQTILFWSTRDGNPEVYLMQADGSNVRNISRNAAADAPTGWSPDGTWIYFRSARDRAAGDIYKMRVDGSEVTRVTTTGANR